MNDQPMTPFSQRLARRARDRKPSPIREFLPLMGLPDMISLGGGYPNPATFAFQGLRLDFRSGVHMSRDRAALDTVCQYGPSTGLPALRETLEEWHHFKDGITPEALCVTNGSQEGLYIAAYLLLEEDDTVLVSEPTYPGAIAAFNSYCRNYLSVPVDEHGVITEQVEALLAERQAKGEKLPKFIYTIPGGHNPAGVNLSTERRRHLLAIAARYDLLILEDDPYQLVRLEKRPVYQPTLQSLDREGRVIRLDSFSKIFTPGLRLGYVTGPAEAIREFELWKMAANLHTSTVAQDLLDGYLHTAGFPAFMDAIADNCALYRRNLEAMVEAAERHLPEGVRWNVPRQGMFMWFELPEGADADVLVRKYGESEKVILIPGGAFSTRGGLRHCMRASFGTVTPERIGEGIRRFAAMLTKGGGE